MVSTQCSAFRQHEFTMEIVLMVTYTCLDSLYFSLFDDLCCIFIDQKLLISVHYMDLNVSVEGRACQTLLFNEKNVNFCISLNET